MADLKRNVDINTPLTSKINYTAFIGFLLGLAVTFGWLPEEFVEPVKAVLVALFPLIIIFRTKFTAK